MVEREKGRPKVMRPSPGVSQKKKKLLYDSGSNDMDGDEMIGILESGEIVKK